MTLGQRIKALRKERSMTQSALCGDYMTRNMLSQIENDQASPSLATVCYIAEQLQIPVGYLLDKEITPLMYRKAGLIELIRTAYAEGRWQDCIDHCKQLSDFDDELALLLADCYLQEGLNAFHDGYLDTAKHLLDTALRFTACTRYPKSAIEEQAHGLLEQINALGIGPQGFGGRTTALAVNIEEFPTHIAGLPVAVNINCHVTRHKTEVL